MSKLPKSSSFDFSFINSNKCLMQSLLSKQIRPGPGPQGASLLEEKHNGHSSKGVMSNSVKV